MYMTRSIKNRNGEGNSAQIGKKKKYQYNGKVSNLDGLPKEKHKVNNVQFVSRIPISLTPPVLPMEPEPK
jgi:hypothetical protein